MGEVYLARDTELDRDVALKVVGARIKSDRSAHRGSLKGGSEL